MPHFGGKKCKTMTRYDLKMTLDGHFFVRKYFEFIESDSDTAPMDFISESGQVEQNSKPTTG